MGQPSPQPYGAAETFWMRTTYDSVSPANATRGASIVNASRAGGGVLSGGSVGHGAGASGKKMPSPSDMPGASQRPPTRESGIGMRRSPVGGANVIFADASAGAGPQSPYVASPIIAWPASRSSGPDGALFGPRTAQRALS